MLTRMVIKFEQLSIFESVGICFTIFYIHHIIVAKKILIQFRAVNFKLYIIKVSR